MDSGEISTMENVCQPFRSKPEKKYLSSINRFWELTQPMGSGDANE